MTTIHHEKDGGLDKELEYKDPISNQSSSSATSDSSNQQQQRGKWGEESQGEAVDVQRATNEFQGYVSLLCSQNPS